MCFVAECINDLSDFPGKPIVQPGRNPDMTAAYVLPTELSFYPEQLVPASAEKWSLVHLVWAYGNNESLEVQVQFPPLFWFQIHRNRIGRVAVDLSSCFAELVAHKIRYEEIIIFVFY